MTASDNILGRVRKMLDMTENNGCTPAEAQTAASMVQRMLLDYNLSLNDVMAVNKEAAKYVGQDYGYLQPTWWHDILRTVAHFNPVKLVGHHPRNGYTGKVDYDRYEKLTIFGLPHNVEIVTFMCVYLSREFGKNLRDSYKQYKANKEWYDDKPVTISTYTREFFAECMSELYARLRRMRDEQYKENANAGAIVLVQDEALKKAYYEYMGWTYETPEEVAKKEALWREQRLAEEEVHTKRYNSDPKYAAEYDAKQKAVAVKDRNWRPKAERKSYVQEARSAGYEAAKNVQLSTAVSTKETVVKSALR